MRVDEIAKVSDPSLFISQQLQYFSSAELEGIQFLVRFDYQPAYLANAPTVELMAIYEVTQSPNKRIAFLVSDQGETVLDLFEKQLKPKDIAEQLNIAWVELNQGLLLEPVHIPKPWGQEVWFTGMEERGVAQVKSASGSSPLDWVVAAAPEQIMGSASQLKSAAPILLKILDPLPDEVYGDLYFEMHEEKQEVYVVTEVNKDAWPDGKGGIRFGFDQGIRATYNSDEEFRQAYLQAVEDYRQVRDHIDVQLDKLRQQESIGLNDPVMPEKIQQWQSSGIDQELLSQEKQLREKMEGFIAIKPLIVGDVVKVPCFTPHSLQHGVTTVEFQTPVYERKILSFAQKVLTQSHWDTKEAIDKISLDAPEEAPLPVLEESNTLLREQIVSFSDFSVERTKLQKGARLVLSSEYYNLALVLEGSIKVGDKKYAEGQALLLPAFSSSVLQASEESLLLIANPVTNT